MATFEILTGSNVIGGGSGGSSYLVSSVTLTDEQIKALPTTPVEIIAAPGIGKAIMILSSTFYSDFTFGAYSGTGSNAFDFQLTWGNNILNATVDGSLDCTSATKQITQLGFGSSGAGYTQDLAANIENQPITISSDNGND